MAVSKFWLRISAAAFLTVGLLGLGLGCKGSTKQSSAEGTYTVSGTLTYLRLPLQVGTDGVPTGIATDPSLATKLPARGVNLRAFQGRPQIGADGKTVTAWLQAGSATTDVDGKYSITALSDDYPIFIEAFSVAAGTTQAVRLVADDQGINSPVPEPSRYLYSLRKGVDGQAAAPGNPTPGALLTADATVNFDVGLNDNWLKIPGTWNVPATGPFAYPDTVAAGSRVLAILDSIYTFTAIYGDATPGSLDLHYYPGLAETRGSFVEYDLKAYPQAYNGSTITYFGSIAGDSVTNDAFNEGVLFSLFARNNLFGQKLTTLLPTGERPTSQAPNLALVDGLADAMVANLLKSPYLPDTSLANRYPARDIRVVPALARDLAAFSAPHLAALTWDLTLKANSVAKPGTATDWARISAINFVRFFKLLAPTSTLGTATVVTDVPSLYSQLARLAEAKGSDAVDLAALFPDSVLTPLLDSYGLTWSGITALPKFTSSWGQDPDTAVAALPGFTLSMAKAEQVRGSYPNSSKGEVAYAMFSLTKDRNFALGINTVPELPAGAHIEVALNGGVDGIYRFAGSHPESQTLQLKGNYADLTLPKWHWVQIRIISPATQQPDLAVTVQLRKTN